MRKRSKSGLPISGNAKTGKPKKSKTEQTFREFVQSMRGKYKGEDLMEELMREKKRERDL